MTTLNDEVRSVVKSFIQSGELFTALDVSNKVKLALPLARHREVRDEVRALFTSEIEQAGWDRTPITVTLTDGTTAEALLYHPLTDSWDLDNKYDTQKRAQAALNPVATAKATLPQATHQATNTGTFGWCGTPPPAPTPKVAPAPQLNTKDAWMQLFNTQPSLFPRK